MPRACSAGKLRTMSKLPIATIASQTASLTVAVFDASTATAWVPTKGAAHKAQFTGHPAEIMRGLAKGEEAVGFDVGASPAFAFELEGKSGHIEVYRIDDATLALVAPPRAQWSGDADALFEDALRGPDEDATDIGSIDLASGKLAAIYMWHKKFGAAAELATKVGDGGAVTFGDGYGDGEGGVVIDAGIGTHALKKRELVAPWDEDQTLVVMYVVRGSARA